MSLTFTRFFYLIIISSFFIILHCDQQDPSNYNYTSPIGNESKQTFNLVIKNDTLLNLKIPVCVKNNSTWQTEVISVSYEALLIANKLILTLYSDKVNKDYINFNSAPEKLTPALLEDSSIIVKYQIQFSRASHGNALIGLWKKDSSWYTFKDLLKSEKNDISSKILDSLIHNSFDWIDITEHEFTAYSKEYNQDYFYTKMSSIINSKYNTDTSFTIHKINDLKLALIGSKVPDTVFVETDNFGNLHYKFSNSKYIEHHYYHNSLNCPNDSFPEWIMNFIRENK